MKDRIPCTIMKDLAPLYAEELTSEETNHIIEAHLEECVDCKEQYGILAKNIMKEEKEEKEREVQEIQYMKKIYEYQKRNKRLGAALAFLLGASLPIIRVGLPILLRGEGIMTYHLKRLQCLWPELVAKVGVCGLAVCGLYLGINYILKRMAVSK